MHAVFAYVYLNVCIMLASGKGGGDTALSEGMHSIPKLTSRHICSSPVKIMRRKLPDKEALLAHDTPPPTEEYTTFGWLLWWQHSAEGLLWPHTSPGCVQTLSESPEHRPCSLGVGFKWWVFPSESHCTEPRFTIPIASNFCLVLAHSVLCSFGQFCICSVCVILHMPDRYMLTNAELFCPASLEIIKVGSINAVVKMIKIKLQTIQ